MSGNKKGREVPTRKAKTGAKMKIEQVKQPIRRTANKPSVKKAAKVKVEKKSTTKKSTNKKNAAVKSESIPADQRPTPEECYYATASLAALHPHVVERNDDRRATLLESCGLRDSITDSVVSTMLSQNTTDKNAKQAFATLKKTFASWSDVCDCDDLGKIEKAIKVAGLAKTRAERIQSLLRTVKEEKGEPSLDYLRSMSDKEVKKELSRFKGLGPKTISCVLLFSMGRSEFPVDTHVLRISKTRLGWVPSSATRESAYEHLNETVPAEVKLDLHCLLVTHGKHCHACAAGGKPQFPPADGSKLECPLSKSVIESKIHAAAAAANVKKDESALPDNDESSSAVMSPYKVKVEKGDTTTNKKVRVKEEDDFADMPRKKTKTCVVKKLED